MEYSPPLETEYKHQKSFILCAGAYNANTDGIEQAVEERFKLYPAVHKDRINLHGRGQASLKSYEIFDEEQNLVRSESFEASRPGTINLEELPAGSFFIKLHLKTHRSWLYYLIRTQ